LIINNHKNDRKGPKVIDLDDKFIKLLKHGSGEYLISNNKNQLYQSSSYISKFFSKTFSYDVYDLRKSICSKVISEGDTEKIKRLEYIQGHTMDVMLKFYNVYSNKEDNKKINKEITIEI